MKILNPFLRLLAFLSLVLTSCNSQKSVSQQTATVEPPPTTQPTATLRPTPTLQQYDDVIQYMEDFGKAWASRNPDEILPYYSENVSVFDSGSYHVNMGYAIVRDVVSTFVKSGRLLFEMDSFFITEDGRFSAFIGTLSFKQGDGYLTVPAMSIFEIQEGQMIWEYDYAGGSLSETYLLPEVPISASKHTLTEEESINLNSILLNWKEAFDHKDINTLSAYYSDQALCIHMIAPDWLVQTKSQMLESLNDKFSNNNFNVIIENYYISANGQYTAVQGEYQLPDEKPQPIIFLLEIIDGKIINQYVYLDNPIYY